MTERVYKINDHCKNIKAHCNPKKVVGWFLARCKNIKAHCKKHQVVSPSAYHVLADNIDTKKNKQKDESSNIVVIETSFKWSNIWGLPC
jgi:ribosome biogenesis protein Tsr3